MLLNHSPNILIPDDWLKAGVEVTRLQVSNELCLTLFLLREQYAGFWENSSVIAKEIKLQAYVAFSIPKQIKFQTYISFGITK